MPESRRLRAARAVLGAVPIIMGTVGASMRSGEVTPHQHRLLSIISRRPRTLSEIAEIQGVTPATATTLVTTLESRGWVRREHDPVDRRRVIVTVTDSGEQALAAAQRLAEKAMGELLEPLSDTELDQLTEGLSILRGASQSGRPTTCRPSTTDQRKRLTNS